MLRKLASFVLAMAALTAAAQIWWAPPGWDCSTWTSTAAGFSPRGFRFSTSAGGFYHAVGDAGRRKVFFTLGRVF